VHVKSVIKSNSGDSDLLSRQSHDSSQDPTTHSGDRTISCRSDSIHISGHKPF